MQVFYLTLNTTTLKLYLIVFLCFAAFLWIINEAINSRNIRLDAAQNTTEIPIDSQTTIEQAESNPYLIKDNVFCGLASGMRLSAHKKRLEKGLLKERDQMIEVYYIQGIDGDTVGYVQPHTKDESYIGQITITTPKAQTVDGIRIGSTYEVLQNQITFIKGNGTKINSIAYAVRGRELFLLAMDSPIQQLQEGSPDPTTKIKAIIIKQHRMGEE